VSVSGRCLLSQYLTGRDGNRGQCAQPCRWKYHLVEETRLDQPMEFGETEEGSYILSADDMCTAPFLDLICLAGVDSLKIEGRAKTAYYVASVTSAYRRAVDAMMRSPEQFELPADVFDELSRTSHRHYSPGFYFGRDKATQSPHSASYIREWEFMGVVEEWAMGKAYCTQRGKFVLGEELEALMPDGQTVTFTPAWIEDEGGNHIPDTRHPMMKFRIPTPVALPPMSLLRKKIAK
ncbi:MAG: U32 family peptidase C-terminal domain-containing protein, partial [Oscillospiraceae bacterium]|nr:U32 family peptidase C-terminal domain-containing protein [Oscillospiraceae bacterium]